MDTAPEPTRKWSWRIGRLAGVAIEIHATFALLLAWIAVAYLTSGAEFAAAARAFVMIGCVFAIIVVHELAHALVARSYGITTHSITLYPIGGMAKLEGMPQLPRQELAVALAGPAINALFALLLYAGLRLTGADAGPFENGSFAAQLMWINITLCAFNLLPAFPMDGGRVLRALLAMRMPRARATVIAARVGRALAVTFGICALLLGQLLLGLIAAFVWIAGTQEAQLELARSALRGITARDAMVRDFVVVSPDSSLAHAAELLARGFQRDFPVMREHRVIGLVTQREILAALADHAPTTPIGDLMQRRFPIADPAEPLADVLPRLPADGGHIVIARDGAIEGLLDAAHVERFLAQRSEAVANAQGVHRATPRLHGVRG